MEETNALEIQFSTNVGTISSDSFATLKEWLDINTARYENLEVTEDNLPDVKKDLADMRKLYESLENERKAVKKTWEAPYKAWEAEYKEAISKLTGLIDEVSGKQKAIDAAIADLRTSYRKAALIKDANDFRKGFGSVVSQNPALWARVWKSEYENKSCTDNKAQSQWRWDLRCVLKDLEAMESGADANTMIPVFLACGSIAETMQRVQEQKKQMKAFYGKEEAPQPEPVPEPMPDVVVADDVVSYVVNVTTTPTEDDLKLAQGRRAFKGPKYKVKALLEFADMLGLTVEKI